MENEFVSHVFDGTNFSCWSFRIEADLKALKLHHCILRTLEEESFFPVVAKEGVAERVRKEALQKSRKEEDEKCKLFLLKVIAEPQREAVRGMSSPKLMWEALKEMSDRKAVRAVSNGTFPSKCRICGDPEHKKVDCPLKKKAKHAAGSVLQLKKGKVHSAETVAGAKEDVPFVPEAEEANSEETDGKFQWVLDSDVSEHMVGEKNLLVNVRRMETPKVVNVAEGGVPLESRYVGEVKMKAVVGKRTLNCTVRDVLYVPGLLTNLFSVKKVAERGMEVIFGRNHARISKDGDVKCTATRNGSLYVLDVELEICGSAVDAEQEKVPEEKVQQEDKVCTDDELDSEESDPDDKVQEKEEEVPVLEENAVPELEEAAGERRGCVEKHPAGFSELELERKWAARPDHELKLKWPARPDHDVCVAVAFNAEAYVDEIPDTNETLQKHDDWPQWKRAIDDELRSLQKNRTWDLVEAPAGRRVVSCKWVFRIKKEEDGTAARYKARLVVTGCSQRAGYDYKETYARIVVRELPAGAVKQLHQTEERKPPGFERGSKVRKMNKSLVGAKALQNRKKRYRCRMLFKKISKLEGAQTERDRRSAAGSSGWRPRERHQRSPLNILFCLRTDLADQNRHQLSGGKSRGEQVLYEEDLQDRKRMNLGASTTSTSVIAGQEELTKLPVPPDK